MSGTFKKIAFVLGVAPNLKLLRRRIRPRGGITRLKTVDEDGLRLDGANVAPQLPIAVAVDRSPPAKAPLVGVECRVRRAVAVEIAVAPGGVTAVDRLAAETEGMSQGRPAVVAEGFEAELEG